MLADSSDTVDSGRLDPVIHLPATAKLELVGFIAEELPRWRDNAYRPDALAETALTEYLCDHLNSAAYDSAVWSHVQFRTETRDETRGGRKIDLAAKPRGAALVIEGRRHTQFQALFPIECKRLPTPKNGRDEREYVATERGTTGGIQRFKLGYHGASHTFAAMIAYIQKESSSHWLKLVNGWICDLAAEPDSLWSNSDTLQRLCPANSDTSVTTLKSRHRREGDLGECELRHLWIRMD